MHNLRDYLLSLTCTKTSLSLLYKKHPKKGAFCVYFRIIKILLSLWLLEKPSLSLLFCHYLRAIDSFHFQHGVSQLPARNLAEDLSRTNDSQHTDTLSCYKNLCGVSISKLEYMNDGPMKIILSFVLRYTPPRLVSAEAEYLLNFSPSPILGAIL